MKMGVSRPIGWNIGGLMSGLAHAIHAIGNSPGRKPWSRPSANNSAAAKPVRIASYPATCGAPRMVAAASAAARMQLGHGLAVAHINARSGKQRHDVLYHVGKRRRGAEQDRAGEYAAAVKATDFERRRKAANRRPQPRLPGMRPEDERADDREERRRRCRGAERLPLPRCEERDRDHQRDLRFVGQQAEKYAGEYRPFAQGQRAAEEKRAGQKRVLSQIDIHDCRRAEDQRKRAQPASLAREAPNRDDHAEKREQKEHSAAGAETRRPERQQQQEEGWWIEPWMVG